MSDETIQATSRPATPEDDPCSCGRPAIVVYITERFGDVPSCR